MAGELFLSNGRIVDSNGLRVVGVTDGITQGFSLGANAMQSTAAVNVGSGFPRLTFPDAATTDAYVTMGLPSYWSELIIGFDWVNDHVAGGNVVWQFTLRGNNVGTTIASPETSLVSTSTLAAPSAGAHTTSVVFNKQPVVHGAFGTLWSLQMSRLGNDGADTLAGSVGLMEVVIARSEN